MEIIILARNKKGYGDLSELITLARRRSEKGQYRLSLDDIATPASGCEHLKNLPDCLCIFKPDYGIDAGLLHEQTAQLLPVFAGRLWLGLGLRYRHADAQHLATLKRAARQLSIRTVAIGQVEMNRRYRQPLHDTLRSEGAHV